MGLEGAEELSATEEEEEGRRGGGGRLFREPITVRDNAKLCIFLQPLSPPFTFPIVTHPRPPHTPLLAQAVNWIVCMQWVCESMSLPVCMWGGGKGLRHLPSPKTPTPAAPSAAVSHLWLEVGMWALWQKL